MNIILSMPNDGQSNNYIINALQDLQHNVYFLDHRFQLDFSRKQMKNILSNVNVDVVIVLHLLNGYTKEDLQSFKLISPQTKFVSWFFDVTFNGDIAHENAEFISLIKEYDYFFTVVRSHVEKFKEKNVNAYWAPEGCCPYSHMPLETVDEQKNKIKFFDVTFIGQIGHKTVHNDRIKLLTEISKKFKLCIYGYAYKIPKELQRYHVGRPTYNDTEHNRIVGLSKINIGNSGWTDNGSFSARNYRICAAAGFLLANRSKELENFYSNEEVAIYDSIDDCIDKIDFYLKNPDQVDCMRWKAHQKTLENYTFRHSLSRIFKVIEEQ